MRHTEKSFLPRSVLGSNRCIEVSTPGHGDVVIKVWAGELEQISPSARPTNQTSPNGFIGNTFKHRFQMTHGSEQYIMAALMGFAARAEMTNRPEIFLQAGRVAIQGAQGSMNSTDIGYGRLKDITNGSEFKRYDIADDNLEALLPPISIHPGSHTTFTGLYFTETLLGPQLAICLLKGQINETQAIEDRTQFVVDDVAVLAGLVAAISKGVYQNEVAQLILSKFSENF